MASDAEMASYIADMLNSLGEVRIKRMFGEYCFYVNEKPENALNRLLKNFNSKMDDELLALWEAKGYDLRKIVTIASLIEKETDGTDQRNIASVIYNRLEHPTDETVGFLNIDASLVYAAGRPITQEDY